MSSCYEIKCKRCEGDDGEIQGVRKRYIGQSGTSAHRRMLSHMSKTDSVMAKHQGEYHEGEVKEFEMKVLKVSRSVLDRLVSEGQLIARAEKETPGSLMNGRGEYNKSKMVRFEVSSQRI